MSNDDTEFGEVAKGLDSYPHFDKAALAQLVEDTGPQVVLRILSRFYTGLEEALNQVEQGIHNDNAEIIWKACHKLTGSAELIGFQDFGEKSRKLNSDMKALPDVQPHTEEISVFLSEGHKILNNLRTSFPDWKSYL